MVTEFNIEDAADSYSLGWGRAAQMVEEIGLPAVAHFWDGVPDIGEGPRPGCMPVWRSQEYRRGFRDALEFLMLAAIS